MKAHITHKGMLVVYAETQTEAYALKMWKKQYDEDTSTLCIRDYPMQEDKIKED